MPAINFKPEFAKLIRTGKKKQTIRQERKNPIKPGDTLQLYTGLRTKQAKKIKTVTCKDVTKIIIVEHGVILVPPAPTDIIIEKLWREDGFPNFQAFIEFFDKFYGLPFTGVLIRWN